MRISLLFAFAPLLLGGCGIPSFLITPVSSSQDLNEIQVEPGQGLFPSKIVIIPVEGILADVKEGGFLEPTENPLSLFVQEIDKAEDDPSVAAIVLRVNSPGGAVATSDTMYARILEYRQKTGKPVIASAQEIDASGAYYVSCACNKIVIHPAGIIGSIGVIFEAFDVTGTLDKIGIVPNTIKSAPMKDIASPFARMTPEERAVLQGLVDDFFTRFKGVVMANRPIKPGAEIARVSDGRVFDATDAVDYGLADQIGRLPDAIKLAKEMAHATDAQVVMYKRPYGYTGSIYAEDAIPEPKSNVLTLSLPG
ncbi:MAG TPA: signal peptide peptidase SppA, partial [Tepidisphaeraceae bacterium]|nr:signal peptide peptidase SppA [Tepidisphaeraceae bacterium]